jgi:hypothetical protein
MKKKIVREFVKIWRDTLQDKEGSYSRTSLTMFSAWVMVNIIAVYDLYQEGFRMDVWSVYVGVSTGMKLIDAKSKQIQKP